MQCLEVSCAVRPIYGSLGAKGLRKAQDRASGKGSCEHGNESLGSIKCREFLDLLLNC
jgi:hypothetical protein